MVCGAQNKDSYFGHHEMPFGAGLGCLGVPLGCLWGAFGCLWAALGMPLGPRTNHIVPKIYLRALYRWHVNTSLHKERSTLVWVPLCSLRTGD